jgi:hypothetical protein
VFELFTAIWRHIVLGLLLAILELILLFTAIWRHIAVHRTSKRSSEYMTTQQRLLEYLKLWPTCSSFWLLKFSVAYCWLPDSWAVSICHTIKTCMCCIWICLLQLKFPNLQGWLLWICYYSIQIPNCLYFVPKCSVCCVLLLAGVFLLLQDLQAVKSFQEAWSPS